MLAGLLTQNLACGDRGIIAGVDRLLAYQAIIVRIPNIQDATLYVVIALHDLASVVGIIKIASERLGHSKIGITLDLYSHVLPGMQAEAAAAVDGALQAAQQRRAQMLANRLQSPTVLVYENKKP